MFPVILPTGIVVNASDIYAEVASYPTVPPDKIGEYWHVYTTTFRKLVDPTAHRLENFWWHVWGSDRRFLSGAVLARMFEDISKGSTIVELARTPAQAKGSMESSLSPPGHAASDDSQDSTSVSKGAEEKGDVSQSANLSLKPLSSSSSKPPPRHTILKKTRGPSSSGPRPTARFISPHESAEEDGDQEIRLEDAAIPKSSDRAMAGAVEMRQSRQSPAKFEKKKSTPTGSKKYIAATAGSKRRPGLVRRMGSQSSGGSVEGMTTMKSGSSGSGGGRSIGSRKSSTSSTEKAAAATRAEYATARDAPAGNNLSSKAAGKRPAVSRSTSERQPPPWLTSPQMLPIQQRHRPPLTHRGADSRNSQQGSLDRRVMGRPTGFNQPIAKNLSEKDLSRRRFDLLGRSLGAEPMARSQSDMESRDHRSSTSGRLPIKGLTSTTTATMSSVSAQGTFEFDQPCIPRPPDPREEESSLYPHFKRPPSILDSRLTPTPPNPGPDVPLGRTRSQLTLLLEREKSRLG